MTRLEAAEMRFLRSVKGYTGLDKIRSEVVRKELETSGIHDVIAKYKQIWFNHPESRKKRTKDLWNTKRKSEIQQNWINHLERMDNTGLQKHALNYKPTAAFLKLFSSWDHFH